MNLRLVWTNPAEPEQPMFAAEYPSHELTLDRVAALDFLALAALLESTCFVFDDHGGVSVSTLHPSE